MYRYSRTRGFGDGTIHLAIEPSISSCSRTRAFEQDKIRSTHALHAAILGFVNGRRLHEQC